MASTGFAELLILFLSGLLCLGLVGVVVFIAVRAAQKSGKREE